MTRPEDKAEPPSSVVSGDKSAEVSSGLMSGSPATKKSSQRDVQRKYTRPCAGVTSGDEVVPTLMQGFVPVQRWIRARNAAGSRLGVYSPQSEAAQVSAFSFSAVKAPFSSFSINSSLSPEMRTLQCLPSERESAPQQRQVLQVSFDKVENRYRHILFCRTGCVHSQRGTSRTISIET